MMKTRSILFLILAVLLLTVFVAVLSTERAEAKQYDVKLTYLEEVPVKMAKGLNPISFNYTVEQVGDANIMQTVIEIRNKPEGWQHYLTASSMQSGDHWMSTDKLDVPIRLGLALIAGVAGAFLLDYLDTSVRDGAEVESMGVRVVAYIPRHK